MCTVTYFPINNESYILTSNRDESPLRSTNILVKRQINEMEVQYPEDTKKGSWIAVDNVGTSLCILNGSREKHKHNPPYKMSRGLLLLEYWDYKNTQDFLSKTSLKGIEPFTLLIAKKNKIIVLRWSGKIKDIEILDSKKPHIFSSSTLYDINARKEREDWFNRYLNNYQQIDRNSIYEIHKYGNFQDPHNAYIMNRKNKVKTVSITQVVVSKDFIELDYNKLY